MIYDVSYFKNELFLPNIDENNTIVNNNEKLIEVIRNADVKFLIDCLGFNIAQIVLNSVQADGSIVNGTDPTIVKLIDGDVDNDWLGLRYTINGVKKSLLANHSFCQYLYQTENALTQLGNVQDEVQNAKRVSNWQKYVSVWNEMISQRQNEYKSDFYEFWETKTNTYGITLEAFIKLYPSTFDYSKFTRYEKVNSFGI